MIRLFVAINLPDWLKNELTLLCSFGIKGVKWVETANFHLSLRFIGEVTQEDFQDISDSLSKIKVNPFTLTLSGLGTFPNERSPRVIWTGVNKNEELIRLQKKVETQLNKLGLKGDKRRYTPHITLGRVKADKPGRIGDFMVQNNLYKSKPIDIESFQLFSSVLTPKGPIYRVESDYSF